MGFSLFVGFCVLGGWFVFVVFLFGFVVLFSSVSVNLYCMNFEH